jgi:hypothetical protein
MCSPNLTVLILLCRIVKIGGKVHCKLVFLMIEEIIMFRILDLLEDNNAFAQLS